MIEIINSIRKYNYWNGNTVDSGCVRTVKTVNYICNRIVKELDEQYPIFWNRFGRQMPITMILCKPTHY